MITREGERLMVSGRLTMSTVPALYQIGLQHLANEDFLVDLSRVEAVDSAAISMLLGWSRAAQGKQRNLRVTGLPDDLLSLAHLYGVAEMLPQ
ncbi:MAG: anti-sigma-factor [Gallionellales bacterium RIFOXYD2_FULL_52_7]|nr:MAG: anti-sigma-factor [Gallionellales bacterium RIFOXYD2_FULL_52_7]